jgi:hypothetical protein
VRETHEEVGLNIEESDLNHAADIVFRFDGTVDVVTRAYLATSFTGEPIETDEMRPQWFALSDIPYDTMWPADREWLPQIIEQTAPLPLGFIIDFTADNQFVTLQRADPAEIKRYLRSFGSITRFSIWETTLSISQEVARPVTRATGLCE